MMDYLPVYNDRNLVYGFSYQELKADYERYVKMSDKKFLDNLPKVLHYACFVAYIKELPASEVLSDRGIIHELIHLLDDDTHEGAMDEIKRIRKMFKEELKLV